MSGKDNKSAPDGFLEEAWSNTVDGFEWLGSVLMGEFADNRPLSAVVADMLVSFVPGVVIVTSARDAVAVILRLSQHPEKREELMEWVLLSACLIALAVPLVMAAGGLVFAGVGAIVGGIAGSQLGALLRGVMLMLIKKSTKLIEMIQFLQKFVRGDIVRFLRAIRFVEYEKALLTVLNKTIKKLVEISGGIRRKLEHFKYFDDVQQAIAKLSAWERKFYAVQAEAAKKVPLAMTELQLRLNKMLAELAPKEAHVVAAGVGADKPAAQAIKAQRIPDVAGRPLMAEGKGAKASGAPANAAAKPAAGGAGAPSGPSKPPASAPKEPAGEPPPVKKPEAPGGGEAPPKLTPDKIEKVPETPNTKRQETHEPEFSHVPASAFNYALDLSRRVGEEAQEIIKSGADKGPAIARVGSHSLGIESPSFFNFTFVELNKKKLPAFPGVIVKVVGGDFFYVDDVEKYMRAMEAVYRSTGAPMHAQTKAAIGARVANRAQLEILDGLPGAHAEVRAQNWYYHQTGGSADAHTIAATYRLRGNSAGGKFIACKNCSNIIHEDVTVITYRTR